MALAEKLKELLESRNISQAELVERAEVSRYILAQVITGRTKVPGRKFMSRVAEVLGVTEDELYLAAGVQIPKRSATDLERLRAIDDLDNKIEEMQSIARKLRQLF